MRREECKSFSDIAYYQSEVNPERVFIFDIRSGRSYNFRRFNALVEKAANYFIRLGVKPGDRITAVIENSPEYCFCYFAAIRIGAIFNPMPFTSHPEEIKKNIRYVEPKIVLLDSRKFSEFVQKENSYIEVSVIGSEPFEEKIGVFPEHLSRPAALDENSPACLYYSSGTTGDPKGVLFSHKNMITNVASIVRGFMFSEEREVNLVFLPMGHTASINYQFLPCMYVGGKMILAESFWHIRLKLWELIQEHGITYIEVVPTVLYAILNLYKDVAGHDLSSLRFVGCGSAPLQKSIQDEFQKRYGLKVANLYGLSETGPTHIDNPLENGWEPGSIGVPLDVNDCKVFGENDTELPANKVGEMALKGPNIFVGYFKNDIQYKRVVRNQYFFTGDLGYKDENGKFYYVDRIKDLIIKGGTNIVPGEIDEVLLLHPSVKEVVTIGIPDAMFGEDIKSFIVCKDGSLVTADELTQHCSRHLPKLKMPKEIDIVNTLPKTHSGKLLRKELRSKYYLEKK